VSLVRGVAIPCGRWVVQSIQVTLHQTPVWYVFPSEKTDDGREYWGACASSVDLGELLAGFGIADSFRRAHLRDSMLALHEVLSELETEYENTMAAAELCPSRRQRRGLENLAEVYSKRLNSLRQFFDWDVYHDRAPANAEAA
jgi:hypothetical protein